METNTVQIIVDVIHTDMRNVTLDRKLVLDVLKEYSRPLQCTLGAETGFIILQLLCRDTQTRYS